MAHAARVIRAAAMPPGTPAVPVAIVGAGACGLTAALMLRDAGIECVLLERDAAPQGSTALSSGFIPGAGTRVQRAAGVTDDSAERFVADIQGKAHGSAAPPSKVATASRSSCSTASSIRATRDAACTHCRSAPAPH
jgi:fumarate reductase flavoprotein subunit